MTPVLHSPGRLAIAAVPTLGFLATPLLPFVNGPHLWFGVPSVLIWTAACVLVTVLALRVAEWTYLRAGGGALDAFDDALDGALDGAPVRPVRTPTGSGHPDEQQGGSR